MEIQSMKKAISGASFAIALLFFLVLVIFPSSASALTISPPRIELEGAPGTSITGKIKLYNEQAGTETFYVSFENFEAKGETGTPSFTQSTEDLAGWIDTQKSISLTGQKEEVIPFSINIPLDAEPGGHFSAIFFSTTPPDNAQIAVGAKIGMLVLLRVSGEIQEGGGIVEFAPKDGKKIYTSLPVEFYYRFKNDGNDRAKPDGIVKMKNMLGITSKKFDANPTEGNVLPASTRRFALLWGDDTHLYPYEEGDSILTKFWKSVKREWHNFAFGRYSAKLDIIYGSSGIPAEAKTSVWVFPWHLLLVILIILTLIYLLGKREIHKYNEWILNNAMKHIKNAHQAVKRTIGNRPRI